jgi:hypothetical protein
MEKVYNNHHENDHISSPIVGIKTFEDRNFGVMWHDDVIRNDAYTWDVWHVSEG